MTLAAMTAGSVLSFGASPLVAATASKLNGNYVGEVLARLNVAVSAPADVTEDTLWTITIPAGSMGANGQIKIPPLIFGIISSTNDLFTFRVRFDGNLIATFTDTSNTLGVINYRVMTSEITITNRNAANSQLCIYGNTGATLAVDTTIAKNITVTVQKTVAGDTGSIQSGLAVIYPST
jgi:hypothetical protein